MGAAKGAAKGAARGAARGAAMIDEIICEATVLLNNRKNWGRGSWARDKDGDVIKPTSEDAAKWDLEGAIYRASWDLGHGLDGATGAIEHLQERAGGKSLQSINDDGGYHEVMRVLRCSIIPKETTESMMTYVREGILA